MKALDEFLAIARSYTMELGKLSTAEEFLSFKWNASAYAREVILQVLNRGVTTFRWMPESLSPGASTGPVSVEEEDRAALFLLNLWLGVFLLEVVGIGDALAQVANAAFDLGLSAREATLPNVHARLEDVLGRELNLRTRRTGLERWFKDTGFARLRDLRNQATHRHLVRLKEELSWREETPPPKPGKWRGEFLLDCGDGQTVPVFTFVPEQDESARALLRNSLTDLGGSLWLLFRQRGGAEAARKRREWWEKGSGPCGHEVVEPGQDEEGELPDCFFCCACGERVKEIRGRKSPNGSTYF